MAGTKAPKQRAPRRSWPLAEKRRIVELTLREDASTGASSLEEKKAAALAIDVALNQDRRGTTVDFIPHWAHGRPISNSRTKPRSPRSVRFSLPEDAASTAKPPTS